MTSQQPYMRKPGEILKSKINNNSVFKTHRSSQDTYFELARAPNNVFNVQA